MNAIEFKELRFKHIKINVKNIRLIDQFLANLRGSGVKFENIRKKKKTFILIHSKDNKFLNEHQLRELSLYLVTSLASFKIKMFGGGAND